MSFSSKDNVSSLRREDLFEKMCVWLHDSLQLEVEQDQVLLWRVRHKSDIPRRFVKVP